jgi:hypothetical protein
MLYHRHYRTQHVYNLFTHLMPFRRAVDDLQTSDLPRPTGMLPDGSFGIIQSRSDASLSTGCTPRLMITFFDSNRAMFWPQFYGHIQRHKFTKQCQHNCWPGGNKMPAQIHCHTRRGSEYTNRHGGDDNRSQFFADQ